jgi:hypothetical protein
VHGSIRRCHHLGKKCLITKSSAEAELLPGSSSKPELKNSKKKTSGPNGSIYGYIRTGPIAALTFGTVAPREVLEVSEEELEMEPSVATAPSVVTELLKLNC